MEIVAVESVLNSCFVASVWPANMTLWAHLNPVGVAHLLQSLTNECNVFVLVNGRARAVLVVVSGCGNGEHGLLHLELIEGCFVCLVLVFQALTAWIQCLCAIGRLWRGGGSCTLGWHGCSGRWFR